MPASSIRPRFRIARIPFLVPVLLFLFLPSLSRSAGGEAVLEPTPLPKAQRPAAKADPLPSIPYPHRSLYVPKGILGGIGFGKYQDIRDDQSQFQWQGEVTFFYLPWLSAGAGGRIIAGEPTSTSQNVANRYFILTRAHLRRGPLAVYAGPQIGFENLNLNLSLSGNGNGADSTDSLANISHTNLSLALDAGLGLRLPFGFSFTGGGMLEFNNDGNLEGRIYPGIAFDILTLATGMKGLVPGIYLCLEYQLGVAILSGKDNRFLLTGDPERNEYTHASLMAGLAIAF